MISKNGGPELPIRSGDMRDPRGMTLRDYFAAKALKTRPWSVRPYDTRSEIAKDCYAMADAMLAEREKTND
jgi:hypothetical protein